MLFGSETAGVPEYVHKDVQDVNSIDGHRVYLPMAPEVDGRSLNLASTAMTAIYEGVRCVSMREDSFPWETTGQGVPP